MTFHGVTIDALGNIQSRHWFESSRLDRGMVDLLRDVLREHAPVFRQALAAPVFGELLLHWSQEGPSTAAASLSSRGELALTSVLVSGHDPGTDRQALQATQQMLIKGLRTGPLEPGFDLLSLAERPLIASIPWPNPMISRPELDLVRQAETCLAAAFFELVREDGSEA